MERKTNIRIFLSACKELKVRVKFKSSDPTDTIERLDVPDWKALLDTLESFSEKFEAQLAKIWNQGNIVRAFKLDSKKIKALIENSKSATGSSIYGQELYRSPYQQSSNTRDIYSTYGTVSC